MGDTCHTFMRKYIYSERKCVLNVSLFLSLFSTPTCVAGLNGNTVYEVAHANVVKY